MELDMRDIVDGVDGMDELVVDEQTGWDGDLPTSGSGKDG
jgi:hypothetical protein